MGCTDSKPKRPSKTQNRGSNVNYTTQENAEGAPKSNAASHIPIQKPVQPLQQSHQPNIQPTVSQNIVSPQKNQNIPQILINNQKNEENNIVKEQIVEALKEEEFKQSQRQLMEEHPPKDDSFDEQVLDQSKIEYGQSTIPHSEAMIINLKL